MEGEVRWISTSERTLRDFGYFIWTRSDWVRRSSLDYIDEFNQWGWGLTLKTFESPWWVCCCLGDLIFDVKIRLARPIMRNFTCLMNDESCVQIFSIFYSIYRKIVCQVFPILLRIFSLSFNLKDIGTLSCVFFFLYMKGTWIRYFSSWIRLAHMLSARSYGKSNFPFMKIVLRLASLSVMKFFST